MLKVSIKPKTTEAPPTMSLDERVALATERCDTIRQRKKQKAVASGLCSARELRKLWLSAGGATVLPVTTQDSIILHQEMKRHAARKEKVGFVELMEWSITNWPLMMDAHFHTMQNRPELPVIRFFVKCIGKFLFAYDERGRLERIANMTTRERMVDTLVRRKGMTNAAAEREVDERLGLTKLKAEIETERRKLQQLQDRHIQTVETEERIAMMNRTVQRKETKAVQGVGGTYEQWT